MTVEELHKALGKLIEDGRGEYAITASACEDDHGHNRWITYATRDLSTPGSSGVHENDENKTADLELY